MCLKDRRDLNVLGERERNRKKSSKHSETVLKVYCIRSKPERARGESQLMTIGEQKKLWTLGTHSKSLVPFITGLGLRSAQ